MTPQTSRRARSPSRGRARLRAPAAAPPSATRPILRLLLADDVLDLFLGLVERLLRVTVLGDHPVDTALERLGDLVVLGRAERVAALAHVGQEDVEVLHALE